MIILSTVLGGYGLTILYEPHLSADSATEPPPTSQRTFRGSCLGVPHVWGVPV